MWDYEIEKMRKWGIEKMQERTNAFSHFLNFIFSHSHILILPHYIYILNAP